MATYCKVSRACRPFLFITALTLLVGCELDLETDIIEPQSGPPTSPPTLTIEWPTADYYRTNTWRISTALARSDVNYLAGRTTVSNAYFEVIADSITALLNGGGYSHPNRLIGADFQLRNPGIYGVFFNFEVYTEYVDDYGNYLAGTDYALTDALFDVSLPTLTDPIPPLGFVPPAPCEDGPEGPAECDPGGGGGGGGGDGIPWANTRYRPTPAGGPYFAAVGYGSSLSRLELRMLGLAQSPEALDELALFFDEVYDIDLFDISGTTSSPFLDAASQLRPHAVQEDNLNGAAKRLFGDYAARRSIIRMALSWTIASLTAGRYS